MKLALALALAPGVSAQQQHMLAGRGRPRRPQEGPPAPQAQVGAHFFARVLDRFEADVEYVMF